jgi:hypothetical protein
VEGIDFVSDAVRMVMQEVNEAEATIAKLGRDHDTAAVGEERGRQCQSSGPRAWSC